MKVKDFVRLNDARLDCLHDVADCEPLPHEDGVVFCFECEQFIDRATGVVDDPKVRTELDDWIDRIAGEPPSSIEWPRMLSDAVVMAMVRRPSRPAVRAIFRARRAWVATNERENALRIERVK